MVTMKSRSKYLFLTSRPLSRKCKLLSMMKNTNSMPNTPLMALAFRLQWLSIMIIQILGQRRTQALGLKWTIGVTNTIVMAAFMPCSLAFRQVSMTLQSIKQLKMQAGMCPQLTFNQESIFTKMSTSRLTSITKIWCLQSLWLMTFNY